MAWTSKISNVIKGKIQSAVGGAISGAVGQALGFANQGQNTKIAAKLLNKSPLEIGAVGPTTHMTENPYSYGTVYYPTETSNLGEGHYIIFDVIMHTASKFKSTNFRSNKIATNDGLVGDFDTTGGTSIQKIKAQDQSMVLPKGKKFWQNDDVSRAS